ncbi:helix-turn-helix domain-containing protein [Chitinophaga qingshengii]|uniref:AraC family transcriptional regulator n=1 Tax=Chitinophaga qingshengii TaxID=1569794 RepID=A0ABR7TX14_9BACT|nr:helix-turn-helix domain-containing protein [Chitinophaga qingshengii]MBC9935017.1 AraC family transcriptional regulator [Chitinophaga qingshengii]
MQPLTSTPENITLAVKQLAEKIYGGDFVFPENFSLPELLSQSLRLEYATVCQAFLATEDITLEKYIENLCIEKTKEWLVYTDDTLPQIAAKLGFHNARQLSAHFKAITGLNPGYFKEIRKSRQSIQQMPRKRP